MRFYLKRMSEENTESNFSFFESLTTLIHSKGDMWKENLVDKTSWILKLAWNYLLRLVLYGKFKESLMTMSKVLPITNVKNKFKIKTSKSQKFKLFFLKILIVSNFPWNRKFVKIPALFSIPHRKQSKLQSFRRFSPASF